MPHWVKRWGTRILRPFAIISNSLMLVRRLWAHSCLAAKIKSPLDSSVVVLGCPEIHGSGQIHFGKNLFLYRELYLETQEKGVISLGDDVVLSRGVHVVAFTQISIGTGTMIGEYSSLRDANHQFGKDISLRQAGHTCAPIHIGSNVWIGRGSTVLAGVTIGDNSVIGANAVVTKSIPANTLAIGIPARPLKRFDD